MDCHRDRTEVLSQGLQELSQSCQGLPQGLSQGQGLQGLPQGLQELSQGCQGLLQGLSQGLLGTVTGTAGTVKGTVRDCHGLSKGLSGTVRESGDCHSRVRLGGHSRRSLYAVEELGFHILL